MARTSTLPKRLQPMLATLTDAPFDDKGWIFEDKYDGFRMVAKIEDGSVILYNRNGKIIRHNYIEVAKALEGVKGDVLGRRFFVALHLPEVPSPSGGTALIWINDLLGPVGDQISVPRTARRRTAGSSRYSGPTNVLFRLQNARRYGAQCRFFPL
jgi:hypothetical protein